MSVRLGCQVAAQILQSMVVGAKAGSLQSKCPADPLGQRAAQGLLVAAQGPALHVLAIEYDGQIAASEERRFGVDPGGQQPGTAGTGPRRSPIEKRNKGLQLISLPRPFLAALAQQLAQVGALRRAAPGAASGLAVAAGANQGIQCSYGPEQGHECAFAGFERISSSTIRARRYGRASRGAPSGTWVALGFVRYVDCDVCGDSNSFALWPNR